VTSITCETYTTGIFSRELMSALEGGADINTLLPANKLLVATADGGISGTRYADILL
jgi:hypothetical protein